MNPTDLDRIATRLHRLADLLEAGVATEALTRTRAWQGGHTKTANLDPTARGWRYDTDGQPIPADPTGEAATADTGLDASRFAHARLDAAIALIDAACNTATRLLLAAVPAAVRACRPTDDDCGDDWCKSCYRDNRHLEPVATRPDGSVKYPGRCRWCKDFETSYKRTVPLELLRLRHQGKRISERDIARSLTADTNRQPKRRKAS